jgi:hypothetical protein
MQAPKFGMLIPNRVFVGGIASNTSDAELKQFFATFGPVKDCKIILDRAGVSKGYGFVTFEQQEDAEKLMKREGEHVLFKDRKLNIGPAIRKQQALPRLLEAATPLASGIGGTAAILYSAGGVPYTFQNGLAMFQPGAPAAAAANAIPDGYTLTTLPQMGIAGHLGTSAAAAAYQPMILSAQQAAYLTQAGALSPSAGGQSPAAYYQAPTVPGLPSWPAAASPAGGSQWPFYAQSLLAAGASGAGPTWQMATGGAGTLPFTAAAAATTGGHGGIGGAGGGAQYYYSIPAEALLPGSGTHHELLYASPGGMPYQTIELADNQLITTHTNEGGILLDAGSSSGGPVAQGSTAVQYVDVQYAPSVTQMPAASASDGHHRPGGIGSSLSSQSYGIKRVLSVPRQVICTPPTSYGMYGPAPPPVKIVAGLGGQRMVTKTVNQTEVQIIPKTQN